MSDEVSNQVLPGQPGEPGKIQVNQVHQVNHVKRHDDWKPYCSPLCRHCLQNHVYTHLIRYPVAIQGNEVCCCPCKHEVTA